MKTYREFRPTPHDIAGLALPDLQDWLVVPVSLNRDSDILSQSNWEVVKTDLEGRSLERDDFQIHEFGHWACGWFRIMLVRPSSQAALRAEHWQVTLAEYPIASESDYSARQYEAICDHWQNMSISGRVKLLQELNHNIFASRRDAIPEKVWDKLYESEEFQ